MEEILSSIKRIIAEEGNESAPVSRASRRGRLEIVPPPVEVAEIESEVAEVEPLELGEEARADNDDVLELTPPEEIVAEEVAVEEEPEVLELTPPDEVLEPVEAEAEIVEVETAEVEEVETALAESEDELEIAEVAVEETAPVEFATEEVETGEIEPEVAEAVLEEEPEEVLELTDTVNMEEAVSQSNLKAAPETILSVESEVAARHSLSALSSMIVAPETGESNTLERLVQAMLCPLLKEWLGANLPQVVEKMVAKEIARITGGVR